MAEKGLTVKEIVNVLSKSPHGDLKEYVQVGMQACQQDPEFFSHLIAWDSRNGQIRDAHVALPVISLCAPAYPEDLVDNSLAHLAMLSPRDLLRGVKFARGLNAGKSRHMLRVRKLVKRYLKHRERNWALWERSAVQHFDSMRSLYAMFRVKPSAMADEILFKGAVPRGTIFESIRNLGKMSPAEAAGTIIERKIPFLIAQGALGVKAKDPDVVLALIQRMSPSELVNNTKNLEKLGIKVNPALRAAFEEGLKKAAKSKKNTLKTTVAMESIEDEGLKEKLRGLQEKQIKSLAGVEGNWLVLVDKSGSMHSAIKLGTMVAGSLAKMVKGKVWMCFFDTTPRMTEVTGMDYDKIVDLTKRITASGGTSIGCGLQAAMDKNLEFDGIAIVSDGGENNLPFFPIVYPKYAAKIGTEPTVYFYRVRGDMDALSASMSRSHIDMQVFDVDESTDYYSVGALAQTMRVERYSLGDEILATKILVLDDVLSRPMVEVSA